MAAHNDYLRNASVVYNANKKEIVLTDVNGNKQSIYIPLNCPENSVVLVSLYNNGEFAGCKYKNFSDTDNEFSLTINYDRFKIMVWNSFKSLCPIIKPKEMKKQ